MLRERFNTFHKGMPKTQCLNCGHKLDAASAAQSKRHRPRPGNFSICIRCGHVMAFADDLTMRPLTDAEVVHIAGDKEMLRYQAAIGAARAARNARSGK